MTLRVLCALAGLVLAYGAAHGAIPTNLILDLGVLLVAVAAVLGWRRERSFIAAWPALLVLAGVFAILGLQTWGFRECGATEQLRLVGEGGGVAGITRSVDPCIVDPFGSKTQTVLALAGVAAALLLAVRDLRQTRRRLSS